MQLWNTPTRRKEAFSADNIVRIYVCGITPYATTHLGHARTYILFDVLIRLLEREGYGVRYAQNVTDVDDPLYERARDLGRSSAGLATDFTRIFQDDMAALNVRPPDYYPRASDEIPEIQRLIAILLDGGHAYRKDGRVYYRVNSFARYGQLGRLDRAEMAVRAGETGEDLADPRKEDPLDFLLWKPSREDEDSWPSPWGPGRPGWHIECSAMSLRYLGSQLDIHGGGTDLIYPHHENEIAQSEECTHRSPFARFWVHVEMVRLDGIKMSKSLGNLVLVDELLPRFGPLALRHYLLSVHYRSLLDYSLDDLRASGERVERFRVASRRSDRAVDAAALSRCQERFAAALADDLDTPAALEVLDEVAQLILAAPPGAGSMDGVATLQSMAKLLGLDKDTIAAADS